MTWMNNVTRQNNTKTFVFLRLVFDGNNKNFSVRKVFVAFFSLKDEFNKSTQE